MKWRRRAPKPLNDTAVAGALLGLEQMAQTQKGGA